MSHLVPGRQGNHELTFFAREGVNDALELLSNPDEGLTVVVGAGSSAEVGFPTWPELLRSIEHKLASVDAHLDPRTTIEDPDPLMQAQMLEAQSGSRERFEGLVERALFERVDKWTRPGPTARAVAKLYLANNPQCLDSRNAKCHIATLNFDIMLELALQEAINSSSPNEPLRVESYFGGDYKGEEHPRARVRHLHGALPGKHEDFFVEGCEKPPISITAADFLHESESWFDRFLKGRLQTDNLLLVGASMRDQHVLRNILQKNGTSAKKVVALIPRPPATGTTADVWKGHEKGYLQMEEAWRKAWEDRFGTIALFPDWYVQVSQFVEELIQLRHHRGSYVPYERRLGGWFKDFRKKRVYASDDLTDVASFRNQQVRWNAVARSWISHDSSAYPILQGGEDPRSLPMIPPTNRLVAEVEDAPSTSLLQVVAEYTKEDEPGFWTKSTDECLTIHLWTRIPLHSEPNSRRHRELAQTVCSDRIWQHPLAVESRRITIPTKRLAIECFISGYTKVRNTNGRDFQWNFLIAEPVRTLSQPGKAPFVAGVLCIQSSLPWTYESGEAVLSGHQLAEDGTGALTPFEVHGDIMMPVSVLRLAHECWRQRAPSQPDDNPVATEDMPLLGPVDRILRSLTAASQEAILDPSAGIPTRRGGRES